MAKKHRPFTRRLVLFAGVLFLPVSGWGQLTKVHTVGQLWDTYKDKGSIMYKDKGAKMQWRDHGTEGSSTDDNFIYGRGIWAGARNVRNVDGIQKPYFVSICGFFSEDEGISDSIELQARYRKPDIVVDDGSGPATEAIDNSIIINPDLPADESIITKWKTPLGVSVTLTTYAYGQDGHDEYIIQDYLLRNTGDMNESPGAEQVQILEDFWFGVTYWPKIGKFTQDDWYSYVGRGYATGSETIRLLYHWDGDYIVVSGNDTGDPDAVDGRIRFQPYIGFGVLHVDESSHAPGVPVADNPLQPVTVNIKTGDHVRHSSADADRILYEEMALQTIINEPEKTGFTGWRDARVRTMLAFGPYPQFKPEEEIRIVMVTAVGGIPTVLSEEIGRQEFLGYLSTAERLALLAAGRDSLLLNVQRSQQAFKDNFNLPDSPPPPDHLSVEARGGHVRITWSNSPRLTPDSDTGADDFAGYYLYRSVGSREGPFVRIATITRQQMDEGKGTLYEDTDVSRGVVYFYRVTAFDDGSQNWLEPGRSLESAPTAANTVKGVSAFSQPATSSADLRRIRVIPNPYNIFGVMNFPGEPLQRNKLIFANLPGRCTIRIFTLSGDLVRTLEHADGSGDEAWDQITDYDQFILSGIYIAHVESDLGSQVVKFVVVR
jgi:hypothetical protein